MSNTLVSGSAEESTCSKVFKAMNTTAPASKDGFS